jgi:succinate dehydrogenase/fumarate reductase cytochrome b subunit
VRRAGFNRFIDFFYSPLGYTLDLLLAAVLYHALNGLREGDGERTRSQG